MTDVILNPIYWLVLGLIIMASELIIPGGVVIFLGLAGVIVAGALFFGVVTTWANTLILWFVTSLTLLIVLRTLVSRFAGGDTSRSNTNDVLDDVGEIVAVVEVVGPGETAGRVSFRGSTWSAVGDGSEIPAGARARVIARDNISLVVETIDPDGDRPPTE